MCLCEGEGVSFAGQRKAWSQAAASSGRRTKRDDDDAREPDCTDALERVRSEHARRRDALERERERRPADRERVRRRRPLDRGRELAEGRALEQEEARQKR